MTKLTILTSTKQKIPQYIRKGGFLMFFADRTGLYTFHSFSLKNTYLIQNKDVFENNLCK